MNKTNDYSKIWINLKKEKMFQKNIVESSMMKQSFIKTNKRFNINVWSTSCRNPVHFLRQNKVQPGHERTAVAKAELHLTPTHTNRQSELGFKQNKTEKLFSHIYTSLKQHHKHLIYKQSTCSKKTKGDLRITCSRPLKKVNANGDSRKLWIFLTCL